MTLPFLKGTVVTNHLNVCAIRQETVLSAELFVLFTGELSETVVLGNGDGLTTRELELGATKGLNAVLLISAQISISEHE